MDIPEKTLLNDNVLPSVHSTTRVLSSPQTRAVKETGYYRNHSQCPSSRQSQAGSEGQDSPKSQTLQLSSPEPCVSSQAPTHLFNQVTSISPGSEGMNQTPLVPPSLSQSIVTMSMIGAIHESRPLILPQQAHILPSSIAIVPISPLNQISQEMTMPLSVNDYVLPDTTQTNSPSASATSSIVLPFDTVTYPPPTLSNGQQSLHSSLNASFPFNSFPSKVCSSANSDIFVVGSQTPQTIKVTSTTQPLPSCIHSQADVQQGKMVPPSDVMGVGDVNVMGPGKPFISSPAGSQTVDLVIPVSTHRPPL